MARGGNRPGAGRPKGGRAGSGPTKTKTRLSPLELHARGDQRPRGRSRAARPPGDRRGPLLSRARRSAAGKQELAQRAAMVAGDGSDSGEDLRLKLTTWSTAMPRLWRERIREGRSLVPALPLDHEAAARALRTFRRLRIPDVVGKPPRGRPAAARRRSRPDTTPTGTSSPSRCRSTAIPTRTRARSSACAMSSTRRRAG
jgi:hypothetical protein